MSYIINKSEPLILTKLTDIGRNLLAKGELTFNYWGIGDSEVNYNRENIIDNDLSYSATTKILRPKDNQPNLKYFISNTNNNTLIKLNNSNIRTLKLLINNKADERGFFSGGYISGFTNNNSTKYVKYETSVTSSQLSGGTTLNLSYSGLSKDDLILIKLSENTLYNSKPVPNLWYKIESISNNTLYLDRELPNVLFSGPSKVLAYQGGEVYDGFGTGNTTAYWDNGTLSFDSSCNITREDVPVWNMNNVFTGNLVGMSGVTYENYTKFGSYDYLGQISNYLGYDDALTQTNSTQSNCGNIVSLSSIDKSKPKVSILHYTNNTISNLYGEFLYLKDGNTLNLDLPNLMYHRRTFSGGTSSGDIMGMSFITSGDSKFVNNSQIEYIDLIEKPSMVIGKVPKKVGRVYPNLKIATFDEPEIVSAMSYKSNRNWTLPELTLNLANPTGGTDTGILAKNQTICVTYSIDGLNKSLPCQNIVKISNLNLDNKNVEFKINDLGLFPYMYKAELSGFDIGFYGYKFNLIYQIVDDCNDVNPNNWKTIDYTSLNLTQGSGLTINPKLLESQSSIYNNQLINTLKDITAVGYNLNEVLNLPTINLPNRLQFGDERFFYGNVNTNIGATIYKTLFDIRINSGEFNKTTNPTRLSNLPNQAPIRVTEVGIFDSKENLVLIGKISNPIKLITGQTIMIELGIDF